VRPRGYRDSGTTNISPADTWAAPSRKIDPQHTVDHDEGLIRIIVVVPNEIALVSFTTLNW
jgi:hypothetical protein